MTKPRAPIIYIFTHLGSAIFIAVIAFIVSTIAQDTFGPREQLAQSSGSLVNFSGNDSTLTASEETIVQQPSLQAVEFLVAVPPESHCENDENRKVVGFLAAPPEGGVFMLTRLDDMTQRTVGSTAVSLPNGTYRWAALPASGYTVVGATQGEFIITGSCSGTTVNPINQILGTADSRTTDSSESANNVPQPIVLPRAFIDNVLVSESVPVKGVVELRIASTDSMKVQFVDIGPDKRVVLGNAKIDSELSNSEQDVWVYFWDSTTFPNREYSIIAQTVQRDGTVLETLPLRLVLQNDISPQALALDPPEVKTNTATSVVIAETVAKAVAPSGCSSPKECEEYCRGTAELRAVCKQYVEQTISSTEPSADSSPQLLEGNVVPSDQSEVTAFDRFLAERQGARVFLDSDNDGVSDFDEINLYLTDPEVFDSDGDGAPDGAEILARTNPLGNKVFSDGNISGEYVPYEDPRVSSVAITEVLAISSISVTATSTDKNGLPHASRVAFSGLGPPNAFITIFIFSEPIVATVKTDASGTWVYTLDRELPDGTHEVVTAIVDAGGKIVARSEPLPFVKQAAAISIGSEPIILREEPAPGFFSGSALLAFIAIILGILGASVSIVGFVVQRRHTDALRHT